MLEQKSKTLGLTFSEISNNFFSDYFAIDSMEIAGLKALPIELIELIKKYKFLRCFTKDGIRDVRVSKILERHLTVVPLLNLDEYPDSEVKRIIASCDNFSANNIYPSMAFGEYRWLSLLFDRYETIDFLNLYRYKASYKLSDLIPKEWRLFRFNNYYSKRLIEFSHGEVTILNRNNPFLDLIICNRGIITGTRKLALCMFFETLKVSQFEKKFLD